MTQPTQDLNSFFSTGGGKSVSWKDRPIGATVEGVIEAVHPPQQVTDPVDGKPKFKKNGEPLMQVRIDLQTEYRNFEMCKPSQDGEPDDGRRSLYVGGWMTGAVGDALRKAGHRGAPQEGAKLSVTLTERTPNENPALAPTNKFSAVYTPPSAAATASYFDTGSAAGGGTGLSAPAAAVTEPEPKKPEAISQEAWNAMDAATKRQLADIPF